MLLWTRDCLHMDPGRYIVCMDRLTLAKVRDQHAYENYGEKKDVAIKIKRLSRYLCQGEHR